MTARTPPPWGIYVHVPWCRVRCPYCAFNVHPDRLADWWGLVEGIERDALAWLPSFEGLPASVYFGGGTPSLLPLPALARLLEILPKAGEITLEANPGTVDRATLRAWRTLGVTRLSLGIQTFDPKLAHLLNRGHTVADSQVLLADVSDAGFPTWSFDLMFGLPGQTLPDLGGDLDRVIEHRPPHVSLYGLTVEPGTPWERAVARGRLIPVDEDVWRAMLDLLVSRLEGAGYERYEVSNFALPGHRSRHNDAVWQGGHYAGLGPGAHGYLPTGERTVMTADPAAWLKDPVAQRERPTTRQAAIDRLLTQIRHVDGLEVERLARDTGFRLRPEVLPPLRRAGLLRDGADPLVLTAEGLALADGVTQKLIEAMEPVSPGPTAVTARPE